MVKSRETPRSGILIRQNSETTMEIQWRLTCFVLLSLPALGQLTQSMVPQTVEFPSGKLHLTAYLWKPVGPGPFPAVLFNHGSGGATADQTSGYCARAVFREARLRIPLSFSTRSRSLG